MRYDIVALVTFVIVGAAVGLSLTYLFIHKSSNEKKSEKYQGVINPVPLDFVYQLRYYRSSYGIIKAVNYFLMILSVVSAAVTLYIAFDPNFVKEDMILWLIISYCSETFRVSLGLESMARPYIQAVRIMNKAILNYKYNKIPISELNKAYEDAEQKIEDLNEWILLDELTAFLVLVF